MHTVVSWDIKAKGEKWDETNEKLKDCLEGYSWVKPLSTYYIVKVKEDAEVKKIADCLKEVAKSSKLTVHVLTTPAMEGGKYRGRLKKKFWKKIKKRAK